MTGFIGVSGMFLPGMGGTGSGQILRYGYVDKNVYSAHRNKLQVYTNSYTIVCAVPQFTYSCTTVYVIR